MRTAFRGTRCGAMKMLAVFDEPLVSYTEAFAHDCVHAWREKLMRLRGIDPFLHNQTGRIAIVLCAGWGDVDVHTRYI